MRGSYIVIEGGEYVGKSTQAARLAEAIGAKSVREPGGTPVGESIRGLLLHPDIDKEPETQTLMHAAQRSELAKTVIEPTLAEGRSVVSDRSWISSAVYQGVQGVPFEQVYAVNQFALGELIQPDLCILLDADPNDVKQRAGDSVPDYYERQGDAFHQQLRERFMEIGQEVGAVVIDGLQDADTVGQQILEEATSRLRLA